MGEHICKGPNRGGHKAELDTCSLFLVLAGDYHDFSTRSPHHSGHVAEAFSAPAPTTVGRCSFLSQAPHRTFQVVNLPLALVASCLLNGNQRSAVKPVETAARLCWGLAALWLSLVRTEMLDGMNVLQTETRGAGFPGSPRDPSRTCVPEDRLIVKSRTWA